MKTRTFKDLIVWQKSYQLVLQSYGITKGFPKSEMYGLSQQIRRAAVSIPSNIAEGYGRKHRAEYEQFLIYCLWFIAGIGDAVFAGDRPGVCQQ